MASRIDDVEILQMCVDLAEQGRRGIARETQNLVSAPLPSPKSCSEEQDIHIGGSEAGFRGGPSSRSRFFYTTAGQIRENPLCLLGR